MNKEDRYLFLYQEKVLRATQNYLIRIVVEIWQYFPPWPAEFPEGNKFKWMAYNLRSPAQMVRFDNHKGKESHYHLDQKEFYFTWISREETEKMFLQMVQEKFGHFSL